MKDNLINDKNQLYYELALMINKEMYNLGKISFTVYKNVEDTILKKLIVIFNNNILYRGECYGFVYYKTKVKSWDTNYTD